jgi:hypothetical protein
MCVVSSVAVRALFRFDRNFSVLSLISLDVFPYVTNELWATGPAAQPKT